MSFFTGLPNKETLEVEMVDDPTVSALKESSLDEKPLTTTTNIWYAIGFAISLVFTILGVALHISEYAQMANSKGYLANTDVMGPLMEAGMVFVIIGVIACACFLFLAKQRVIKTEHRRVIFTPAYLELLRNAPWTASHTILTATLTFAVAIDVMKPATISFIMPGLLAEYKLTKVAGSVLPTVAIAGTVIGALLWGYMADRIGRRYSLLFTTILFIATSICGAMPSFATNIFMCFLMGTSVGGLIPVAISLMSETVPSRIRSKVLIIVLAVGSAAGYLLAAAFSYLLQTYFAWRVLWFVGIPTGMLMFPFCNQIPESFRYLVVAGQLEEACVSMKLYLNVDCTPESIKQYFVIEDSDKAGQKGNSSSGNANESTSDSVSAGVVVLGNAAEASSDDPKPETAPSADIDSQDKSAISKFRSSLQARPVTAGSFVAWVRRWARQNFGDNGTTTAALCCLSLAWGLCNYGFITYVPTMMTLHAKEYHMNAQLASQLIFYSSASACAFVPIYVWMYAYWSTRFATAFFAWMEFLVFMVFAGCYTSILSDPVNFCVWYTFLLVSSNALTAMLTVYSAECFSTNNRGKGTGFVSASTKVAGVVAPYFITNVITFGYLWQISVIVGVPLVVGAAIFTTFAKNTHTFEPDFDDDNENTPLSAESKDWTIATANEATSRTYV